MILVVDDDDDIREMIAEALVLNGYRVSTAPNGTVALEQARAHRLDLIILDLMMPVMNGWQFLEAQREDPDLATIPVVVVTATLDAQVESASMLLRKPFDLDTLLTIVARLCGGKPERLEQLSA
jgi:CheY-like chemotaxis protein